MRNIAKSIDGMLQNTAGNVTIEFGFVILFMVTLGIGAYDFGNLGYQKIAVTSAARAGSQFGVQDMSTAEDTAGMIQAARNDINDTANALDISADNYYFCPGQGEVADESILCDDDTFSYFYVTVTVEDEVELLFPYPFVTSPQVVASTNIMRVR
ncbi:MAG: pilus assembly protein [Alphaproteobacteria bacterium]|nr:MAG: pilus assembly protein [Alphaproteobacteria bacterium]